MAERSPLFLGLVRPPKLLGLPILYAMVWLFGSVLLFVTRRSILKGEYDWANDTGVSRPQSRLPGFRQANTPT